MSHSTKSLLDYVKENDVENAKQRIEAGDNVNMRDYYENRTPIFFAIKNNNAELTQLLINNGANVNVSDEECVMPLNIAINTNNTQIVKMLIDAGVKINYQEMFSIGLPLTLTIYYNEPELTQLLLDGGADIFLKNNFDSITPGQSSLDVAREKKNDATEIIENHLRELRRATLEVAPDEDTGRIISEYAGFTGGKRTKKRSHGKKKKTRKQKQPRKHKGKKKTRVRKHKQKKQQKKSHKSRRK